MQLTFSPASYCFEWTNDHHGIWYTWDRALAHKQALAARNKKAKELQKEGKQVSKFSLPSQLITKGGIGTSLPQIELLCNVYGLNAY